ncbi:MAG: hypothetical protein JO086_04910 [Acidimicrobiia bacterium]|nr:hypothetical protein [Acidimicrobiia bacterium]
MTVLTGVAVPLALTMQAAPGSAQTCSYPFDNCPTTSTSPTGSTTPGNTSTTTPGATTTTPGATTTTPGATTTTPGATTTTPGNTTTTVGGGTNPGSQLVLIIDLNRGKPGSLVRVMVCNAPAGTLVQVTFNGTLVAQATASDNAVNCSRGFALAAHPQSSGVLAVAGPLAAALAAPVRAQVANTSGAQTSFSVPTNLPDGQYLVCGQSPGLGSACAPFTIDSTSVAASVFGSGNAPLLSASNPNSFLAFTGMGLMRLLLLAAALIGIGWYLARRDHRNHRGRRASAV